ncbi:bifunctional riboflavin kinase/FAD synthetase [Marinihelvus fidelis]|uniref:Riboflavin biosynthesis protein n=1 Tax=Marinihelvus fidelis TaxID=2613842 RepID=A0A5N0TDJ9_9GAMM|nr:bifunctional riboflavin kinase/FAD synthetase [Marinihelvus fidelis]KAA9132544.1 bifunctional riboflavin kinase/FAD synthetase [Marinihelvus fidelis]
MRFFRDPPDPGPDGPTVVTIGNFDGVHLGHQALIRRCRQVAGESGRVAVVTFEPLPRAWFSPDTAPPRLAGPAQKLALLQSAGVDLAWVMRFNGRSAALGADDFVTRVLVQGLAATHVVIGHDFRFGCGREGDFDRLRELGRAHGFGVEALAPVQVDGQTVSSTVVRAALTAGRFDQAAAALGRRYTLCGRVIRGRQLGRKLGYPTANVRPPRGGSPLAGIYAVHARVAGGPWRPGVASLGHRPAVGGGEALLEVHLFDFDGDLYGQRLETRFVEWIREERNFDDLAALTAQMNNDEDRARAILAAATPED